MELLWGIDWDGLDRIVGLPIDNYKLRHRPCVPLPSQGRVAAPGTASSVHMHALDGIGKDEQDESALGSCSAVHPNQRTEVI